MNGIEAKDRALRGALAIAGLPLSAVQAALSRYDATRYGPVGELVPCGDGQLHAIVTGSGGPTVILESGMGGCSLDWTLVQPALSKYATVLAYDRAGFGWSSSASGVPTCAGSVEELRELLRGLHLAPPYLLVGHSYGGMIMQLFAAAYPQDVMGLVLVDAAHAGRFALHADSDARRAERAKHRSRLRLGYLLAPLGIPRYMKQWIGTKRLPGDAGRAVRSLGYRSSAYKTAYAELIGTADSAAQLERAPRLPPHLPVIVLTAGRQTAEWLASQRALLRLTERTKQIVVPDSWHAIHIHQPRAVIEAVAGLISAGVAGVMMEE
ncbi:alpha/beta fold hydrolase [Paenibacillus methanolicus]|uniref:Pimeloyl-ACP methyl ester carboxylesterase n=1 Tax=Paenibacillus methanolicus TaxID=582686 RepID=A0A5S5CIS5_9BACL|nr:alpha/beta hydrolase [Paenibacillus methanolicus]TYP78106.1 pimeloyl-ACP methyl ester carboxylesterase [Paenibacillus methanolicus]